MKILILSDLHLEFDAPFDFPTIERDLLLLCGDIHIGSQADRLILDQLQYSDVFYILGNHEYYRQNINDLKWAFNHKNPKSTIHRINREAKDLGYSGTFRCLQDDSFEYNDFRIAGCTLWASMDYDPNKMIYATLRMNDYRYIYKGEQEAAIYRLGATKIPIQPQDTTSEHQRSVEYLTSVLNDGYKGKTIVMTHHGPSLKSIHDDFKDNDLNYAYVTDLEYLMLEQEQSPILWAHGHVHNNFDYMVGDTQVVTNPKGYPIKNYTKHLDDEGYFENQNKEFSIKCIDIDI